MMMSVPGFQKRGGGMMILSRFCYKPEDVDCRYCLHYRRRSCQVRTCPYIAERLKSGAIEYLDLILEYFGHIPHAGLHKRIQAVEHWSGPDQAVLHTVSVHLRSRFADRVWDDAPPGYLAALYLLASKERLWQPALSALSHDSIDFSCIVSKPHGFAIQDYPIFYSARRLYDLKSPMEAEDLAHPKLVSDLDFHNIIYATMIAVGSLYMFSVPRGYMDGFVQWCKQIIGLCLTTFLQATILTAGLLVLKDHALLGLGLMLSAGEVPRICGAFGLDTSTRANIMSAVYAAQSAVNTTRTVVQAVGAAK